MVSVEFKIRSNEMKAGFLPLLYTQPGLFIPTFFLDCFFIFSRLFTREKKDEKKIIFFNV